MTGICMAVIMHTSASINPSPMAVLPKVADAPYWLAGELRIKYAPYDKGSAVAR